jgi:protein-tyrosine-phosphatase
MGATEPPVSGLRPVRVLFTCTANRVRSPFAEYAARARLEQLGLSAVVRSAGLLEGGRPAIDEMAAAARRFGYDLSAHRSASVIAEDLDQADIVVPMTGWHVVELCEVLPAARAKILTLREWAAATERDLGILEWNPSSVRDGAARIVSARRVDDLLGGTFDIADPIGGPRRGYRRAAQLIDTTLATCFAPLSRGPNDRPG